MKVVKPAIVVDPQTTHSLQRLTTPRAEPEADLSAAAMLSQLHGIAAMLVQEVQISDKPTDKRLAMAKDLAKLIPLLAHAERKVHKGWKNLDVEDMTDAQLRKARLELKGRKK